MTNCIQPTNKVTGQKECFNEINARLCWHFRQPFHEKHKMKEWDDAICYRIAILEETFKKHADWLLKQLKTPNNAGFDPSWLETQLAITNYLDRHYTANIFLEEYYKI